jgi:hypothetical protein
VPVGRYIDMLKGAAEFLAMNPKGVVSKLVADHGGKR